MEIATKILVPEKSMTLEGAVKWICTRAGTKEVLRESPWKKNKIMFGTFTGADGILKRLGGNNTYSLNILYGEIGKGTATPTTGDTALGTPILRVGSPVISQVGGVLTFQFFFPDGALPNDVYAEVGSFIDGLLGTLGSGIIFNHALFATLYTKGSNEDTTVQMDFTLTTP